MCEPFRLPSLACLVVCMRSVVLDLDRGVVRDHLGEDDEASGTEVELLGPDHSGWAVDVHRAVSRVQKSQEAIAITE